MGIHREWQPKSTYTYTQATIKENYEGNNDHNGIDQHCSPNSTPHSNVPKAT